MNKKLIAMAIAAAAAAPMAANADATAYARLQAEIASIDTGAGSDVQLVDKSQSFFGVKGSEELGDGLTMFGDFQFKIDSTTGSISSGSRLSYVGIKGGMGSFMMGSLKSPYKYSGGVTYDEFVATTLEARGTTMSGSTMGHNGFVDDMVGVNLMDNALQIAYGIDETSGTSADVILSYKLSMGKKDALNFAVYSQGDAGDYQAVKVGGNFGAIKVQVESTDTGTATDTNLFVAYSMDMAGGNLVIQGGSATGDSYNDDVVDVTVGYVKKFTKTARWFAGLRSTTGDTVANAAADDKENTTVTYGMRFDY